MKSWKRSQQLGRSWSPTYRTYQILPSSLTSQVDWPRCPLPEISFLLKCERKHVIPLDARNWQELSISELNALFHEFLLSVMLNLDGVTCSSRKGPTSVFGPQWSRTFVLPGVMWLMVQNCIWLILAKIPQIDKYVDYVTGDCHHVTPERDSETFFNGSQSLLRRWQSCRCRFFCFVFTPIGLFGTGTFNLCSLQLHGIRKWMISRLMPLSGGFSWKCIDFLVGKSFCFVFESRLDTSQNLVSIQAMVLRPSYYSSPIMCLIFNA